MMGDEVQAKEELSSIVDLQGSGVYDELDERIASAIVEIEKKTAETEAVEKESKAVYESLEPLLGKAFLRR